MHLLKKLFTNWIRDASGHSLSVFCKIWYIKSLGHGNYLSEVGSESSISEKMESWDRLHIFVLECDTVSVYCEFSRLIFVDLGQALCDVILLSQLVVFPHQVYDGHL